MAQLVGRARDVGRLEVALDALGTGEACTVALVGEPGIGKTRLLSELQRLADGRDHLVLAGRATELEDDLPFGVFVAALDEYLASLEPQRVERLGPDLRAELARVFPSVAHARSPRPQLQHGRYRAHRAVRELLERLAAAKPVLLVLDDIHWADPASIELLSALLYRPPQAPVLLALGLRLHQAPDQLATALRDADAMGSMDVLELGPLSREDARLLDDGLRTPEHDALYEECGGNPFFLEQLIRSAHRGEGPTPAADRPLAAAVAAAGVPRRVGAAIAAELADLDPAVRTVLNGAAVAGDPFEPDLAAAAAAVSERDALDSIDELVKRELVRETDVPRRFRFRHPLVRRAIYAAAPAGWRIGAHERVGQALGARGTSVIARAHHVEQSARPGDVEALTLLKEAGRASIARAPASAARWLEAALRLMPEGGHDDQRLELLTLVANAHAEAGRLAESHRALLELLERVPADALARRVSLTIECATAEHLLGRHLQARGRLEAMLAQLADQGSHEAAGLQIELAMDAFYRTDYEAMERDGRVALSAAEDLGEPALYATASALMASGAALAGHIPLARERADAAAAAVDALPDAALASRPGAAAQLGWTEFYLERYDASIAHLERGIAVARTAEQNARVPVMMEALACSLSSRGRLADAGDLQDRSVEAARLSGNDQRLCWALFNRAWTARLAGEMELALRISEESLGVAERIEGGIVPVLARAVRGVVLLETDAAERGGAELLEAAGGPALPRIPGPRRCVYFEPLVRGALLRRRIDEAATFADRAEREAAALMLEVPAALAGRARAAVLLATADAPGAAALALESAARADSVGARIEAARSRMLAGRALAADAQTDRARAELTSAAAEFDACGAAHPRDEALRELRRHGGRFRPARTPNQRDAGGFAVLSDREREVAELVRDRHTNREIAAELFLSEKTVESHMRNIFAKLGVSSRVAVARALEANLP